MKENLKQALTLTGQVRFVYKQEQPNLHLAADKLCETLFTLIRSVDKVWQAKEQTHDQNLQQDV